MSDYSYGKFALFGSLVVVAIFEDMFFIEVRGPNHLSFKFIF